MKEKEVSRKRKGLMGQALWWRHVGHTGISRDKVVERFAGQR